METIIFIFFVILTVCSSLILAHRKEKFLFYLCFSLCKVLALSCVFWVLASVTNSVHGTDICEMGVTIVALVCICIGNALEINTYENIERLELAEDLTGLTEDEELLLTNCRKVIQGRE